VITPKRNVANRIDSERRRKARERRVAEKNPEKSVALDPAARNSLQEADRRQAAKIEKILAALNARDREFFRLYLGGVRATERFARLLQIEHWPVEQQRREVKRHKNRIRGFLKRRGLLP
jgi:hypothetical protein